MNEREAIKAIDGYLTEIGTLTNKNYDEGNAEKQTLFSKIDALLHACFNNDAEEYKRRNSKFFSSYRIHTGEESGDELQQEYIESLNQVKDCLVGLKEEFKLTKQITGTRGRVRSVLEQYWKEIAIILLITTAVYLIEFYPLPVTKYYDFDANNITAYAYSEFYNPSIPYICSDITYLANRSRTGEISANSAKIMIPNSKDFLEITCLFLKGTNIENIVAIHTRANKTDNTISKAYSIPLSDYRFKALDGSYELQVMNYTRGDPYTIGASLGVTVTTKEPLGWFGLWGLLGGVGVIAVVVYKIFTGVNIIMQIVNLFQKLKKRDI